MSFEGRHLARNVRCSMFRCAVLSPCLAMCLKISAGEVHECWQHFHRSARPFHFLRAAAKSKIPHHLADLLIFSPRWDVADYPFQPQYYYRDRNGLMKFMDLLYGKYGGCSEISSQVVPTWRYAPFLKEMTTKRRQILYHQWIPRRKMSIYYPIPDPHKFPCSSQVSFFP